MLLLLLARPSVIGTALVTITAAPASVTAIGQVDLVITTIVAA